MGALVPGDQGSQVQVPEVCSGSAGANTARFSTLNLRMRMVAGTRSNLLTSEEVQCHGGSSLAPL